MLLCIWAAIKLFLLVYYIQLYVSCCKSLRVVIRKQAVTSSFRAQSAWDVIGANLKQIDAICAN